MREHCSGIAYAMLIDGTLGSVFGSVSVLCSVPCSVPYKEED